MVESVTNGFRPKEVPFIFLHWLRERWERGKRTAGAKRTSHPVLRINSAIYFYMCFPFMHHDLQRQPDRGAAEGQGVRSRSISFALGEKMCFLNSLLMSVLQKGPHNYLHVYDFILTFALMGGGLLRAPRFFQIARRRNWTIALKLSSIDTSIRVYKMYISLFWYRWPKVRSVLWPLLHYDLSRYLPSSGATMVYWWDLQSWATDYHTRPKKWS